MRKLFVLCAALALGAATLLPTTSHSRIVDNEKVKEHGSKYRAKSDKERIADQYIVVLHD